MANIADCAVAIDMRDIKNNDTLKQAIRRLEKPLEGYESVDTYISNSGNVYRRIHDLKNGYSYTKNNEPTTREDWVEHINHITFKRVEEVAYSNGWRIDLNALRLFPYDSSVEVAEFDDHLTLYFGGRWAFPDELEDRLNELGVLWQGASAEGGCDYYDSKIGNEDFGLRWYKGKDEDGDTNWWVEDTTNLSKEELNKFEKE